MAQLLLNNRKQEAVNYFASVFKLLLYEQDCNKINIGLPSTMSTSILKGLCRWSHYLNETWRGISNQGVSLSPSLWPHTLVIPYSGGER